MRRKREKEQQMASATGSAFAPGYRLFDSDNHYYEPRDCFTRFIEPKYRAKAIRVACDAEGRERIVVGDKPFTFLGKYDFDHAAKPGALREMLRMMNTPDYEGHVVSENQPGFVDRDARLPRMDEQGIESTLMFPTLAVCVEQFMTDDAEQMYANLHAFNRWLDEDWGFNYQDRIYAPPLMSLLDLEKAVDELEFVIERGARIVALRPGPAYGRSPADPYFDPFWARVNEAGICVVIHAGDSGYTTHGYVRDGFSAAGLGGPMMPNIKHFNIERAAYDFLITLAYERLFERFPNLRIASVENGAEFLAHLLDLHRLPLVGEGRIAGDHEQ